MSETTEIIFGIIGGLALFIYGMIQMGDGLKKVAGEKMRKLLEVLTGNPFMGILVGALVTAIIQSSSATTVMVIGFISAGLMTLPQGIAVMMGANIGTTITAQLIAFKIGHYAYPIAFLGFILMFVTKKKNIKYIGQTIFAFGILFIGINTMSSVMKPLAKSEAFQNILLSLKDIPVLGLITGAVMTMIAQSSSAVIGVLQSLASTPKNEAGEALIPLATAIPILLGSNIGTTITAIIASIGANLNAKRAALANSLFNIFGSIIFMFLLKPFTWFMYKITPSGPLEYLMVKRQIANSHTLFNIINTAIWIPLIFVIVKIVLSIIKGEDNQIVKRTVYLDKKLLSNPSIAMELAAKELSRMAKISLECMNSAKKAYIENNYKEADKVFEIEETIDHIQCEIVTYLSTMLSSQTLTHKQSIRLTGLMHAAGDIERIGDYCENIAEAANYKISDKLVFSDVAISEIKEAFKLVSKMVEQSVNAIHNTDINLARHILNEESAVDSLEDNLRASHLNRIEQGLCNPLSGISFIELIHNLERIADHCTNIAETILRYYKDSFEYGEDNFVKK